MKPAIVVLLISLFMPAVAPAFHDGEDLDHNLLLIFEAAGVAWDKQQKLKSLQQSSNGWGHAEAVTSYGNLDSMFMGNPQDLETHIQNAINVGLSLADKRIQQRDAQQNRAVKNNDFLSFLLGDEAAKDLREADARDGWQQAEKKTVVLNWVDEEAYQHFGRLMGAAMLDAERKVHDEQRAELYKSVQRTNSANTTMPQDDLASQLNSQLIAAANRDDNSGVNRILKEMQSRRVSITPEAQRALEAQTERYMDAWGKELMQIFR